MGFDQILQFRSKLTKLGEFGNFCDVFSSTSSCEQTGLQWMKFSDGFLTSSTSRSTHQWLKGNEKDPREDDQNNDEECRSIYNGEVCVCLSVCLSVTFFLILIILAGEFFSIFFLSNIFFLQIFFSSKLFF